MIHTFSVGSLKQPDILEAVLNNGFTNYKESYENNKGEFKFFTINIQPEEKENFATLLADFIINYCENLLVSQIIKQQYYYFNQDEREKIFYKSIEKLNPQPQKDNIESYKERRKKRVKEKIANYLDFNEYLILEGFINFRLKDYCYELELAVEDAVDEYLLEKEYDEFIRLLKYFVDIQEPKVKKVDIVIESNGLYKLYDEENKLINSDYLDGFIVEIMDNEVNYEDLLISSLITIAPEFIVIHGSQNAANKSTLKTIKSVFGDKVEDCKGCEKCSNLSHSKK